MVENRRRRRRCRRQNGDQASVCGANMCESCVFLCVCATVNGLALWNQTTTTDEKDEDGGEEREREKKTSAKKTYGTHSTSTLYSYTNLVY